MNGPRIPWSFTIALVVFLLACGFLGYALGFSLVINGVNHSHGG